MKLNVNKQRGLWWSLSGAVILAGVIAMALSWNEFKAPLRPGLDFLGGTRLQLERDCRQPGNCDLPIDVADIRQVLQEKNLGANNIQILGKEKQAVAIRTPPLDEASRNDLKDALTKKLGKLDANKSQIDTVGPTLGRQLFTSGLLALLLSFLGIVVYLTFRFQLDFALFAVVALFHDLLVTVGVFSILGLTQGVEVDSLFIVGLLTIIGFSVNDTVVIYDRVRENLKLTPHLSVAETVDNAVNQTLGRSINTSLTTALPLVGIFAFGGETLRYFALTLMVGFVAGVYSSVFIASTLLTWWRERQGQGRGGYNSTVLNSNSALSDASPEEL
ncbi:MAG: protein translocase subunit SecF [Acaryochloridaceae cyanobacterium SU_2_1]|nr:protein translocase subunit SecF [Acaryochloridaceae cyanobacterium SU_2_1]